MPIFPHQYLLLISLATIGSSLELFNCATNIAVIICKGRPSGDTILSETLGERHRDTVSLDEKVNRQIQQTLVLFKSIAITQRHRQEPTEAHFWTPARRAYESCINFIVVGKDPLVLAEIEDELSQQGWDSELSGLIHLTFVQAAYPKGLEWMEHVYRQCATLRLFLPEILPTLPKLIYVDTDIIFLSPPTQLQSIFNSFTPLQLAAITPELVTGNATVDDLYNPQHYNTGVMLMHLERMRKAKWSSNVAIVAELTLQNAFYGDQDVLIVYFQSNPEELFHLPCHWNYMPKYCQMNCGQSSGISVLHGLVGSFIIPSGSPFEVLYRYYKDFSMYHFSIRTFNKGLGDRLWTRTKTTDDFRNYCARFLTNRDGNEPTFASAVMKTMTRLETPAEVSKKGVLRETSSPAVDNTSMPTRSPQPLQAISYPTTPMRSGDIVIAVTLVESQYYTKYRQTELLMAMLKSIMVASTPGENITLVIVTDNRISCEKIEAGITSWNDTRRIPALECVIADYIESYQWMKYVFKPGVFFRLYYANLIRYDAVIHVDTDFIFNRPITQLWSEFKNFKEAHLVAAARQLSVTEKIPTTAFQAGIMLMNLTRLREANWSSKLTMIIQILKQQFLSNKQLLPVQTILHLYFKHHPQEVMELNIGWNFLPHYCQLKDFEIATGGGPHPLSSSIYAIHGVNNSFTRPDTMEPLFQEIHLSFLNWNLNKSGVGEKPFVDHHKFSTPCSQSRGFILHWF